jgi:hypothetical protein
MRHLNSMWIIIIVSLVPVFVLLAASLFVMLRTVFR